MKENKNIRQMITGNDFFPDDKDLLKKIIDDSLINNHDEIKKPFALIVPSENNKKTDKLYGNSYPLIKNKKYDTVIVISPLNKISFYGLGLTMFDAFSTPFGDLEVDKEANSFLNKIDKEFIIYTDKFHTKEFSIEIQLPYIAYLQNKVKILPIIIGETNTKFTILLARALTELIKKDKDKYLIITTTNLSSGINYNDSKDIDNKFLNILELMNPDTLSDQLAMKQVTANGGGGVVSLLRMTKELGISNFKLLKYLNTYELNEDKFKTFGYFSACLW